MKKIKIFDTTLRDGEQSPGCSMNLNEKLKVARQLARLKVDIIEAGFAISSPGDFESVQRIANEVRDVRIASLARSVQKDIDAAAEALKGAADPCIHVFLATSPLHMRYKLHMSPEQVLESIEKSVAYARNLCADVEFSAEDASRSDRGFLSRALSLAIKAGASTVNIPDTVGYATPAEMEELVRYLLAHTEGMERACLSVHCHDDLGLGVANSLAAVAAGATQVECTINGIGERAGNASLEEIVMALKTRGDRYGAYTDIDTTQIFRTSRRLARIIGQPIPPNKAIVGANAFAHEAGIHQHGVLQNRATYEIMSPADVGIAENNIVLGKHSGRHAFLERLVTLGYRLPDEIAEELFTKFKALCDKKKYITDFDVEALVDSISQTKKVFELENYKIVSGNQEDSMAMLTVKVNGERKTAAAQAAGPVLAAYQAIDSLSPIEMKLEDYSITSVTEGQDALGQVTVKVSSGGSTVAGRGLSLDILESSVLAYIHALNKLLSLGVAQ